MEGQRKETFVQSLKTFHRVDRATKNPTATSAASGASAYTLCWQGVTQISSNHFALSFFYKKVSV